MSLATRLRAGTCAGLCALMLLLLGGCAQLGKLVPQTVELRTGWPEGVPRRVELTTVPFFPQTDYQCGPAALATVLSFSGVPVTPEPLVSQVYLPARKGSLQVEMLATPRRYGRVPVQLAPRYVDLLREVAAGNPVLVMQDIGPLVTQWHYAVVVGFNYENAEIYLRSGTHERQVMTFTAFERTWIKSDYWAMVVAPPDRVPPTATEDAWMASALALERLRQRDAATQAYAAAVRRWPGNATAAVGLANQLHERGSLMEAAAVLRRALAVEPKSPIIINNLAQTLSDQGRQGEALAHIDQAPPGGPFADELRATRELILQRRAQGQRRP